MFNIRSAVPCIAIALVGCAPLPPLPKFNATSPASAPAVGTASPVVIGTTGYRVTTSVVVPPDVCSGDAYLAGFRNGFTIHWNREVGSKEGVFALGKNKNPAYAFNWSLYRGKNVVSGDDEIEMNRKYGPGRLMEGSSQKTENKAR